MKPLKVNIVSNIRDGKGLARDCVLLQRVLNDLGHGHVRAIQFDEEGAGWPADLTIFCEVTPEAMIKLSPRNWYLPNPDWWRDHTSLDPFEHVLCKTQDAFRLFSHRTSRAVYTGFFSDDRYLANVSRERRFWHNPGGSVVKGTEAILTAWSNGITHPLTVVGALQCPALPNVTYLERIPDEALKVEQNRHLFHLYPSRYEGFGHCIHEGMSTGAVVATPDAAPFTEWPAAVRIPVAHRSSQGIAETAIIEPSYIKATVERMASMGEDELQAARAASRAHFLAERSAFRDRLAGLLDPAHPVGAGIAPDPVERALAHASELWMGRRDQRLLRRALLNLLAGLEEDG